MANNNFVYQQVFRAAIFLTLLSGGCSIWLSSQGALTHQQEKLFTTSDNTWKVGAQTIFALLGNGAIGCSREEEEEEE